MIKETQNIFVRVAVIILLFACGSVVGAAYTELSNQFPKVHYPTPAGSPQPDAEGEQLAAFVPTFLNTENVEQERQKLRHAVFGSQHTANPPKRRQIGLKRFAELYAGQKVFARYYENLLRRSNVSVSEVEGTYDEVKGYVWKSLLFRQQENSTRRLFIYHHGHDGSAFEFDSTNVVISKMIATGFDVLVLSMPMVGWNVMGDVRVKTWDGWGHLSNPQIANHAVFEMIDSGDGHFIKFFLEPIISSMDAAFEERLYDNVTMVGHSGGGWSTTLASALDTRIDRSISYAGTLPFFARRSLGDLGDAEQYSSGFYREFPYTVLYELASASENGGRVHYQVFNSDDTCCFGRSSWPTFQKYYEVRRMPDEWDLRIAVVDKKGHHLLAEALFDILRKTDGPSS